MALESEQSYLIPSHLRTDANFWGELADELPATETSFDSLFPLPPLQPVRFRDNLLLKGLRRGGLTGVAIGAAITVESIARGDIVMAIWGCMGSTGSLLVAYGAFEATSPD